MARFRSKSSQEHLREGRVRGMHPKQNLQLAGVGAKTRSAVFRFFLEMAQKSRSLTSKGERDFCCVERKRKMITSLCMNPCIDRTLNLASFACGGMNRAESVHQDGAGKGVNVALAGSQIGLTMGCIGILGQENGYLVTDRLRGAGIAHEFVMRPGAIRCNTKIVDASTHQVTEINEAGEPAGSGCLAEVLELCGKWAEKSRALVLSGSLPPRCPRNYYAQLMDHAARRSPGCALVVDAEGEALSCTLDKKPYLIKPNWYELETLCGRSLDSLEQVMEQAQRLWARGAQHVAVSLGREGVLGLSGEGAWYAPALPCPVQSTVGAGDSMLAAMTGALLAGEGMEQALIRGVALATAAVATPGTGWIDTGLYHEALKRVKPQKLS